MGHVLKAIGSIGGAIAAPFTGGASLIPSLVSAGLGGLGEVGNFIGGQREAGAQQQVQNAQQQAFNAIQQRAGQLANMTPGQQMALLNQFQQPLNQNLVNAIVGPLQGQMAQMGLGQSAGQMEAAMGTALAPYQQQNIQNAMQMLQQYQYGPLQPYEAMLNATTNLPGYFGQNQGSGNLLLQGLQGLSGGKGMRSTPFATTGGLAGTPTSGWGPTAPQQAWSETPSTLTNPFTGLGG